MLVHLVGVETLIFGRSRQNLILRRIDKLTKIFTETDSFQEINVSKLETSRNCPAGLGTSINCPPELVRKIDWRLVNILSIMVLFCLVVYCLIKSAEFESFSVIG